MYCLRTKETLIIIEAELNLHCDKKRVYINYSSVPNCGMGARFLCTFPRTRTLFFQQLEITFSEICMHISIEGMDQKTKCQQWQ